MSQKSYKRKTYVTKVFPTNCKKNNKKDVALKKVEKREKPVSF